jgi:SAM-dependent methyltransferase
LDVGSGTGYGTIELLTSNVNSVGVDIWKEGIGHSHQKYGDKAFFLMASALALPFRENCFSLVVSFQVIEHINPEEVVTYLEEIRHVLRDTGKFVVSTPNRRIRLLPLQRIWNPDHTREYDAKELKGLLERVFEKVDVLGLFATKTTYMVEYYRVKQNPLSVCIPTALSSRIRRILPSAVIERIVSLFRKFRRVERKPTDHGIVNNRMSIKDFKALRRNLGSCIDLYGVCEK